MTTPPVRLPATAVEVGNQDDLVLRLGSVAQQGRKLVVLFGSGVNPNVASTAEMADLFRAAMPLGGASRFDSSLLAEDGAADRYQKAATFLKITAGDAALRNVVRVAVMSMLGEGERKQGDVLPAECERLEDEGTWDLPKALEAFARFYADLPGKLQGPILTTNFDPSIELSLRRAGMQAGAIPIPYDTVPTAEMVRNYGGIPVLHLHGYWTSNATLSTISHLTRPRPGLERLLERILVGSTVLVLGYGGWRDAFMTSLSNVFSDASDLDVEVIWGVHEPTLEGLYSNDTLRELVTLPGFTCYTGVDASDLFMDLVRPLGETVIPEIIGFSKVEVVSGEGGPGSRFLDGAYPTWRDAMPGVWPRLTKTEMLIDSVEDALSDSAMRIVAAVGPVGEGKSLALKQTMISVHAMSGTRRVLWREPGAPRMTSEWWSAVLAAGESIVLGIDDADLVLNELVESQEIWGDPNADVVLVLACHDRYWARVRSAFDKAARVIDFGGIDAADAASIATSLSRIGVIREGQHEEEVATEFLNAASSGAVAGHGALLGAMLEMSWSGGAVDRVADLVGRLDGISVNDYGRYQLSDVYLAICLMQVEFDPYASEGLGAARELIRECVQVTDGLLEARVMRVLGQEAAISFVGERVYSRHPAIAKAAVDLARSSGRMETVAEMLAAAGTRMRFAEVETPAQYYQEAYRLASRLTRVAEVRAAATASVQAAPDMLEPRVNLMAAMRKAGATEFALKYGKALAENLGEQEDFAATVRGFLNELAVVCANDSLPAFGLGVALLGLDDRVGFTLDRRRANYLFHAAIRNAVLYESQVREKSEAGALLAELALRVCDSKPTRDLAGRRAGWIDRQALRDVSLNSLATRLIRECSGRALRTAEELKLPLRLGGQLALTGVVRLGRGVSGS